jgi:glycosyltransferase involved in cell wall biosynthesis
LYPKPLVSIILPVYNNEKYVRYSIDSVLSQNHANWELLVVNDGSTDTSKEIIESYSDKRIIKIHQQNKGVSGARNSAMKRMSGDYFCFLDADDTLSPNSLSSRLGIFLLDSGLDFVDEFL